MTLTVRKSNRQINVLATYKNLNLVRMHSNSSQNYNWKVHGYDQLINPLYTYAFIGTFLLTKFAKPFLDEDSSLSTNAFLVSLGREQLSNISRTELYTHWHYHTGNGKARLKKNKQ
jgi:hypothetical protein